MVASQQADHQVAVRAVSARRKLPINLAVENAYPLFIFLGAYTDGPLKVPPLLFV
jgi:hypothetical protein